MDHVSSPLVTFSLLGTQTLQITSSTITPGPGRGPIHAAMASTSPAPSDSVLVSQGALVSRTQVQAQMNKLPSGCSFRDEEGANSDRGQLLRRCHCGRPGGALSLGSL